MSLIDDVITAEERQQPLCEVPPGLDGETSPQTQQIAQALGAAGFALNRWWVITPPDWTCSVCRRPKRDIARLNHHGALMGELHAHHDHMRDYVARRFHEVSAARGVIVADADAAEFIKRAMSFVCAFDETVICADCNAADARAKHLVGAHSDFSFAPAEIAQFVIAAPNRENAIDASRARALWQARRSVFETRLRFIDRIAALAAADQHWFVASSWSDHPEAITRVAQTRLEQAGYPGSLGSYIDDARTVWTPPPDLSAWRRRPPERPMVPTPGQIAHAAQVTHARQWRLVPDDWTCPGCGRGKIAIVRPSAHHAWAFVITDRWFHDADRIRVKTICCNDCNHVVLDLAKEAGVEGYRVDLQDLRDIVIPTPHARHAFRDDDTVARVIRRLQSRRSGSTEPLLL
jgi:rubredoxin